MQHKVPFYKNSPDSTRCTLACLKMLLGVLEPHREYTWQELDEITGKKTGLGAWHFGACIYLSHTAKNINKQVIVYEKFPYKVFRFFPVITTLSFFGLTAGVWQVLLSHLRTEARTIPAFLSAPIRRIYDIPTVGDIEKYINDGYACLVQLNGYALDGEVGYGGHTVLVVGHTNSSFIIHNPRLPGSPNKQYGRDVFVRAWHSPYAHCANLVAVEVA